MTISEIILTSICLILFFSFFIFSIVSIFENEKKAFTKSLILSVIALLILYMFNSMNFNSIEIIRWIFITTTFLIFILLFSPIYPEKFKIKNPNPKGQIDERDVMFSRNELIPGTENHKNYYESKPKNKISDDKFRKFPGLLSEKSSLFKKYDFAVSIANFKTVEYFKYNVNAPLNGQQEEINSQEISKFIKTWMKKIGVIDIGITELKPYHFYSFRGRNYNYSDKVENNHKYGIALTVEMDNEMLKDAPNSPTIMESSYQYLRAGNFAMQLAAFIRTFGYEARAHIDGNYEVVCPLVAKDAGLGEIGRMGLLMSPKLGPRLRIAVVTTNMPLIIEEKKDFSSMTTFCESCKKCANNCPSNAISKTSQQNINGVKRWQISQEKCFTYWTKTGTDCAKCIAVCPFSHPNNILHNFVRLFISKSYIFSRFAILLDDFFYGKKPKAIKVKWLKKFD